MHFLLDQCVPISALNALQSSGFEANMITDYVLPNAEDQLVAAVGDQLSAIIVSHDRDFKKLVSRKPDGQITRFKNIHLVKMDCKQMRIAGRIIQAMPIIQSEFKSRETMKDKRMILWIGTDKMTVWR